jgi:phage repressor protein C with HTH and peptisase S24 domain
MIIGERIRERLAAINKKQSHLAEHIGVSQQAVSKMVNGSTNDTSKLWEISQFLRTTPAYLSGETDISSSHDDDIEQSEDMDTVELDEIDLRYGMGSTFNDGHVVSTKRKFSRAWLRGFTHSPTNQLFWAIGDGDSMEPTIRSGEVVLIDRSHMSPRMGDGIWAIAWGEVNMIKRLRPMPNGTIEVHSDNSVVRPTTASEGELHVIGRVIAVVRKL